MNTTINQGIKKKALILFCVSLMISLFLTFLISTPSFTDSQVYVLFLMFFSISLWLTEAIPPFAVALFIMAYLVFTLGNGYFNSSPEKIDQYVNTFSSSIIWLLLGGFFLAKAMTKTRFDEKLLRFTLKISGTKPANIVIAIMFTAMVASMVMSNTAASSMLVAALLPLMNLKERAGLQKALLLGISIATATGGMATIIGTPVNVLSAGILEHKGLPVNFLQWMIYCFPVSIALTAIHVLHWYAFL